MEESNEAMPTLLCYGFVEFIIHMVIVLLVQSNVEGSVFVVDTERLSIAWLKHHLLHGNLNLHNEMRLWSLASMLHWSLNTSKGHQLVGIGYQSVLLGNFLKT